MNKQELLKEVRGIRVSHEHGLDMIPRITVLYFIEELDEPQKVVIPQFVAECIENYKMYNTTLLNVYKVLGAKKDGASIWVNDNIDLFARAWLDGYEVEKEKLYTVEIPNPNRKGKNRIFLHKDPNTSNLLLCKGNFNPEKNKTLWLTESEIRKDFDWAWQAGFAKEVE